MKTYLILLSLLLCITSSAQQLKPGFDKEEYRDLMHISARTTANPNYFKDFPESTSFKMLYQSEAIGLDNLWDLWTNDKQVSVISIRGTTLKPESWLANFYAAMVPAKGSLKLNDDEIFNYQLAKESQSSCAHWLVGEHCFLIKGNCAKN
ncbi:MAG TPA: hypothetical protein PLY70_13000 [Saprospiraceae bacterium]|nr:hypothetical protein [Saprospiraceae bacterium]HPN72155.1 hypothetical protein [Saprospiraceae bacterium]